MPPPLEVKKYINNIKYNDIQYQNTKSVLCGYYCLYFLKRLNESYKIYDILAVPGMRCMPLKERMCLCFNSVY